MRNEFNYSWCHVTPGIVDRQKNMILWCKQTSIMQSEIESAAKATKQLAVRVGLTTAFVTAYSVFLGNQIDMETIKNGLAVGAAAAGSEALFRYAIPGLHLLKSNGANSATNMAMESAAAAALYTYVVFPRAFPGASVPMQDLALPAFGADLAAQFTQPVVAGVNQEYSLNKHCVYKQTHASESTTKLGVCQEGNEEKNR
jgi:hypothetical protein